MRQKLKKIVVIGGIIFICVFVTKVLLDNPYTHSIARTIVNEKLSERTNLVLHFEALKMNLAPLGVDLFGVQLFGTNDFKHSLLSCSRIKARVSMWSILMGSPRLSLLEISNLDLSWPVPWEFPGFLKKDFAEKNPERLDGDEKLTWPLDFPLPVERIVLEKAKIYADLPVTEEVPLNSYNWSFAISGLDLDVNLNHWDDGSFELNMATMDVSDGQNSLLENGKLSVKGTVDNRAITVEKFSLVSERTDIDGSIIAKIRTRGYRRLFESISIAGDFNAEANLSILGSFLELGDTKGVTKASTHVDVFIPIVPLKEDEAPTFSISGQGHIQDGYLDGFRLFNSGAEFVIDDKKMIFKNLQAIMGEQQVGSGYGELSFEEPIEYSFTVKPDGLQLGSLLETFDIPFDLLDFSVSNSTITVKGQGIPFSMTVRGEGKAKGLVLPAFSYDHSRFPKSPDCLFSLELHAASTGLNFDNTKLKCFHEEDQSSVINLSGGLSFSPSEGANLFIKSESLNLNLAEYYAQTPITGTAEIKTHITGPYDRIAVITDVLAKDVSVENIPLGTVQGTIIANDHGVTWQNLVAKPKQQSKDQNAVLASPRGSIEFNDELLLDATISAVNIPPETIAKIFRKSGGTAENEKGDKALPLFFGIERFDAEIKGPLLMPFAYQGKAATILTSGSFEEERLFDRVAANVVSDRTGWQVKELTANMGSLAIQASMRHTRIKDVNAIETSTSEDPFVALGLSLDDKLVVEFDTSSKAGNPTDDHLKSIPYAGRTLQEIGIEGHLDVQGRFEGPIKSLQGTISGKMKRVSILKSPLAPIGFQAFINAPRFDIVFNHAGNSLQGRLSFEVQDKKIPYAWYISCKELDIRPIATSFFSSDPRNFVDLTADWQMQGDFLDWWHSKGSLTFEDLNLKFFHDVNGLPEQLSIKQEQSTTVIFDGTRADFLEKKPLKLGGDYLNVKITTADNMPPNKLGINFTGDIDLKLARKFLPQIESASGKIRFDGLISGSVEQPKFAVSMSDLEQNPLIASSWEPVSLGIADLRPPLQSIKLKADIVNGKLFITSFSAEKGGGTINANGTLDLAGKGTDGSNLALNFKNALVIYPFAIFKSFDSVLSGNITISGASLPYQVSGEIEITKANATREFDIKQEIINALRGHSFSAAASSEEPSLVFDMKIIGNESIHINNRNIQAVLSPNLTISGDDINPIVNGQIEIVRGKFNYKQDFRVTSGLITFDNPVKPDPSLDIEAESKVNSNKGIYTVKVAIRGRASNPTIDFSVFPSSREDGSPITTTDILFLLSSETLPDTDKAVGTTRKTMEAEAANILVSQLEQPIERIIDLSGQKVVRQVYIDTYPSQESGLPVPRFNVPVHLSDRLTATVSTDSQSSWKVSSEYSVHDSISLELVGEKQNENEVIQQRIQTPAELGADLRFRFAFE